LPQFALASLAFPDGRSTLDAMNAVSRPGARGYRRRGSDLQPRTRIALACALMLVWAWAVPASASVLYRCVGAGGQLAYVSRAAGYRHCVKVGEWRTSASARPVEASSHVTHTDDPSRSSVLPGIPPRPVKANPAILKVTPLGDDDAKPLPQAHVAQAWQPLPVVALNELGSWVLPRVLGVELAPVRRAPPASASSTATPVPATTAAIPLKLDTAASKPPRTGAVYKVVQKNGTVLYTNIASLASGHNAKRLFTYIIECYACDLHSKIDWNTVPLHLVAYHDDIRSAARLTGVNAALLRAIIHAESGFNPRALSYKGAQGLMQLMPGTAFELGVGDAFDPAQNISGGARYLATLLRDYHGDVKLAAAAYNAGEGAVAKYGGVPPYAQTQVYVKRVALLFRRYRKALAARGSPSLATAE
jgi:soluble lytic murein transglycosylase-like protein